jgi:hypothetical protein
VWVLMVAVIGRCAPTAGSAAARAAVFFAAMTVAYYAWAAGVLGFGWSRFLPVWLLLSATAVALFAAVVHRAARTAGLLPGAVVALTAGTTLAGGAFPGLWSGGPGSGHLVQGVVDVVVALLLLAVLPSSPRTRVWAVLLVVPATAVADRLLDVLRAVTG